MTIRRRFTADFKAKVALEGLRGDRTIQEIAAKYKVHPNQVSTWKRQAMDGLGAVFSNGADRARVDHEGDTMLFPNGLGQLTRDLPFPRVIVVPDLFELGTAAPLG